MGRNVSFNKRLVKFTSNLMGMKHEKAVKVIIDNFIELSEQDFKDFQRGGL